MSKREENVAVADRECAPEVACLRFEVEDKPTEDLREYIIRLARHEGVFEAKEAVRQQQ